MPWRVSRLQNSRRVTANFEHKLVLFVQNKQNIENQDKFKTSNLGNEVF